VDAIAARARIRRARAELAVNALFDAMAAALDAGHSVVLRRFGAFTVRLRKPYRGRHPRSGRRLDVRAKRQPFFRAAEELREIVNDGRARPIVAGEGKAVERRKADRATTRANAPA
jgi:integration host factor subunit beta